MALQQFKLSDNPINASADKKILIPLNSDFYQLHIPYSGFVPGAATGFKLHRSVGTNPTEASFSEITDSEVIIADENGVIIYRNDEPERADFLMLEYTADGNDAGATYSITKNIR